MHWLTGVILPILFGVGSVILVLWFDEIFDFVRTRLNTRECVKCSERKDRSECKDYWGYTLCEPCLTECKKELRAEEERRLLHEEIAVERRRVAARDYVQAERDKKGYRG